MALVLGVKKGGKIYIEDYFIIEVIDVIAKNSFIASVYTEGHDDRVEYTIGDRKREEVLPNVFISSGDTGFNNNLARVVIEAPKDVKIHREGYLDAI